MMTDHQRQTYDLIKRATLLAQNPELATKDDITRMAKRIRDDERNPPVEARRMPDPGKVGKEPLLTKPAPSVVPAIPMPTSLAPASAAPTSAAPKRNSLADIAQRFLAGKK